MPILRSSTPSPTFLLDPCLNVTCCRLNEVWVLTFVLCGTYNYNWLICGKHLFVLLPFWTLKVTEVGTTSSSSLRLAHLESRTHFFIEYMHSWLFSFWRGGFFLTALDYELADPGQSACRGEPSAFPRLVTGIQAANRARSIHDRSQFSH